MKRLFAYFVAFLFLTALVPADAFAAGRGKVTLSGDVGTPVRGDSVTATLELNRNPGIESLLVTLRIDPEKLEFLSIRDFELLPQFEYSTDEEGGEVVLRWRTTEDRGLLTDTGHLAEVTFRVKEDAILTDTAITPEINELYFDAVDDKGNAVPFDTEGISVPLVCYHVNTEKTVVREATFAEAGEANVTCLDCKDAWQEEVLPVVQSEDGKTRGEVRAGQYRESDTKKIRTDYIFGGSDYETAKGLFGDTVVRVFRTSFIRNDSVFDPEGEDLIYLSVDFDLPQTFELYRIREGQGEKVDALLEEGVLSFSHFDGIFVLVSEEAHLPPVTQAPTTKEPLFSSEMPLSTALSEREKEKRGTGIAIAAGLLSVVLFGTGAVLILRKKERF